MNIRNNISSRLRVMIRKCINLLDVEYKTLDYTIDFFVTRERLEKERKNKPDLDETSYNQILNGKFETSANLFNYCEKLEQGRWSPRIDFFLLW